MPTISELAAPAWFDMVDPDDRVYWSPGVEGPPSMVIESPGVRSGITFATKRAALIEREKQLRKGYSPLTEDVRSACRARILGNMAKFGTEVVFVLNEGGDIVEEIRR